MPLTGSVNEIPERVREKIADCVNEVRAIYGSPHAPPIITPEVVAYIRGYLHGRGVFVDVTDAVLAKLLDARWYATHR